MRKTTLFTATVSCLATLTFAGTSLAQSAPPPAAQPTPSPSHAHQQGMDHGGQQMHDQMMQDHQAGMQKQQGQQGMAGMSGGAAPSNGSAMADKPMSDCCEMPMKKAKPAPKKKADKPMADKPMSDM
ncbi:MAG: hypothetical protein QHC67_12440 [Sphingobium sp.]|uniref:hypothetical protein n=1 Tax=Sphingobium sp. TaxID=1912891 RepID=UPI0029AD9116|nr:hypothetical protein [Sphingobium sp.]MDX3910610.1 hypothetical protein [Sphingobium sp.]